MVTGDYGLTAEAIARRIGIVRGDKHVRVITGVDLDDMTEADLQDELQKDQDVIFARVAPEHKMDVVTALKGLGQIVAVTGDGVNDAPALKKADIGVAMGLTGTDVAREAATMILLDDSFASIIKAVEQGRGVYANVRKMVTYIFSHNMAQLFPFIFAAAAGVHLVPLGALQVLAIDLGSDVLPGPGARHRAPRAGRHGRCRRAPACERLLSPPTIRRVVFIGAIESFFAVSGFLYVLLSNGWTWGDASWMDPSNPHYLDLPRGHHHDAGGRRGRTGRQRVRLPHRARVALQGRASSRNRFLLLSEIIGIGIMCAISYVPFLQNIFKTAPLTLGRLGLPRRRRRHLVLRRRSEKMVPAPQGRPQRRGANHFYREGDSLMKVIIVGCGRVGAYTAASLARQGHDVVVIDKDPAGVPAAAPRLQRPHHQGVRVRP